MILGDMSDAVGNVWTVHLAGAAQEHEVFLCNARPSQLDARLEAMVDRRAIYLEGTPGRPWSAGAEDLPDRAADGGRRLQLLAELIEFHQIDVIHASCEAAAPLARNLAARRDIPWFGQVRVRLLGEGMPSGLAGEGQPAAAYFFDPAAWPGGTERPEADAQPPLIPLPMGILADHLSRSDRRWEGGDEADVYFHVRAGTHPSSPAWHRAVVAAELLNALPPEDRSGRRARLVLSAGDEEAPIPMEALRECRPALVRGGAVERLAALVSCDVLLSLDGESASAARLEAALRSVPAYRSSRPGPGPWQPGSRSSPRVPDPASADGMAAEDRPPRSPRQCSDT